MTAAFFDAIIFGFLFIDGALLVIGITYWTAGSKAVRYAKTIMIALLAIAWLVIFYGSFIEPRIIVINRTTIDLPHKNNSVGAESKRSFLNVALISDFHLGPYKQRGFVERAVKKLIVLKPDIVVMAGDFVLEEERAPVEWFEPFRELTAQIPTFAVVGNHEYTDGYVLRSKEAQARSSHIVKTLEKNGVRVLINEGAIVGRFSILGVDDVWTWRVNIAKALTSIGGKNHPLIVVAHNPDIIQKAQKMGADLVLAGHTHGGQIRLPFWGPVPQIPTRLGNRYDRGLFQFGATQMFITSGIGETGPRARLFVPPEIAMLTIKY